MSTPTIGQVLHTMRTGGAEVLAARLAQKLSGKFRFVFFCLDERGELGEALQSEGFPVHVLGRRPGLDWRCSLRLARLARQEGVDLLHAHQYTPFFYAITARCRYRRPPVLFTEHGRHFPDHPRKKRMLLNRLLLCERDRVIGVGEAVRQALIANEGIPASRVSVIYNGIDTAAFNGPAASGVRQELGIDAKALIVLQVARLDYLKDHATAVRTLERVVRQRPDTCLVLVGEGPEREGIERLVAERKLGTSVRLVGLRTDVARFYRAADVFLLTSISEGIPLTVIEAMAAGLPVVGTAVGGMAEVVVDGETGFLVPSGNDAELAGRVVRLAAAPELGEQMGRAGRIRAQAQFSEATMHARYQALYEEMLRGR